MQESPGWAPSGMACPWVDVLGRGWGRKQLLTLALSGCLTQILPSPAPRAGYPATFLGGEGTGALGSVDHISQPHAEDRRGPGGESRWDCSGLSQRTAGLSELA